LLELLEDEWLCAFVSRQQSRPAEQALLGLPAAHDLAQKLGQELGRGEVLLGRLPACQGGP
jgi:hypothetical protein